MVAKKKVVLAVTKGNWGGAQRYVFDLATNLPKSQFDVVVVCGEGENLKSKLREKNIRVVGIECLGRDISVLKDIQALYDFFRVIKKERPDIVHLNSSKVGLIGSLAARLAGTRHIVFTGHGWAFNEDRSYIAKLAFKALQWLTITLSHSTIAVSEEIAEQITAIGLVPKSKIFVVHNGIGSIEYLEHFAARASLNGKINEKFWVGTIAELHKNKGLDYLIRAFERIERKYPDTVLIVAGEGEERENLTNLISSLGLSKKVHLLGFVKDAANFLKAFDLFVLPSRTEAFPYVPMEAGLAQIPVIASRVGGIPELIETGRNGILVESGDISDLALSIEKVLQNSAMAATFGHNLRKTVEEKFSISVMIQKTKDVYNSR